MSSSYRIYKDLSINYYYKFNLYPTVYLGHLSKPSKVQE